MAEIRHLASWCKNAKTQFSQKLRNLELWCLLTTYRKLCKLNWAFQRTHYWIPTIQDGWDPPSWKSAKGGPIWIKFRRLVQITEWCHSVPVILQRLRITLLLHMALYKFFYIVLYWLRWCVEMETICRIPIWRTFGRIQRHVIPRPRVTLQGVRIPSGILKIVFRHILFCFCFWCSLRFDEWGAFVSSPIHLLFGVGLSIWLR